MRLDPELIRAILLWAEENLPSESSVLEFPSIAGYNDRQIAYHCLLAHEERFFESIKFRTLDGTFEQAYPQRLTYEGHQYLERIRDPEIWRKTKQGATRIGSVSLETLGELAKGYIKKKLKKKQA